MPAMLIALTGATKKRKAAVKLPPARVLGDAYVLVQLDTAFGTILLQLDPAAPKTVANFMRYVDSGRYNGMTFYRSMHFQWGTEPNGLIQGGINSFPDRLLSPVPHEPTTLTGLSHTAGTISMARNAPGTARGDFFIMLADTLSFDADPKSADPDSRAGYAAFGRVVVGMDIVRRIYDAPRSPTKGAGIMKGQMLDPVIKVPKVSEAIIESRKVG